MPAAIDDISPQSQDGNTKVIMVIEGTQIKNFNNDAYYFKVFSIGVNHKAEVYQSRRTILDRPCWRDDSIDLDCQRVYRVEIYRTLASQTLMSPKALKSNTESESFTQS